MGTFIVNQTSSRVSVIERPPMHELCELLPKHIADAVSARLFEAGNPPLEEIRLRSGGCVYLTAGKENLKTSVCTGNEELSEILSRMCQGSLYAYSESIIKGYISLGGGIRVGVCGRAGTEHGRILGVYDISSLNIRLPTVTPVLGNNLIKLFCDSLYRGEGVLIYAPPGEGKTTLLRGLVAQLSGRMRVSLIDTREELAPKCITDASLDVLRGYPMAEGIQIATAFMNPQLIICDEIGSEAEAQAIVSSQNRGVPLIASAHGSELSSLLMRQGIYSLHKARVFGRYIGVRRSVGTRAHGFAWTAHTWEEAEHEAVRNNTSVF